MEFQGFQSSIPFALVVLVALFSLVLAWLSYRNYASISSSTRFLLTGLRALALLVVLTLLLNPFFFTQKERSILPKVVIYLDNSESIAVSKNKYNGLTSYNSVLTEINPESKNLDLSVVQFGDQLSSSGLDSVTATAAETDLDQVVQDFLDRQNDVEAGILFTDGIRTVGKNPAIDLESSMAPLYVIGLGDTAIVQDISIIDIDHPSLAYVDTEESVQIQIQQSGFENQTVSVGMYEGERLIDEKQLRFQSQERYTLNFRLPLEDEGLKNYEVRIQSLEREWTIENNNQLFVVDVLNAQWSVLHIANQIHPDVKAVRSILATDQNIDLVTLTSIAGNRFIETLPKRVFDLVIIHGSPLSETQTEQLNEYVDTPTLFLELPFHRPNPQNAYYSILNQQNLNISSYQILPIEESNHPILELDEINFYQTPTLFSRSVNAPVNSTTLINTYFQGLNTNSPAVSISQTGNQRRGHIAVWGWYLWAQSPSDEERNWFTQFFNNMVVWASNEPDDRLLRVALPKKAFSVNERPNIKAVLQNESGEPETGGSVEFILTSDTNNETQSYPMQRMGNGEFEIELDNPGVGTIGFEAIARKEGEVLDRQTGEFIITRSNKELSNTMRNDNILRQFAANSRGAFFVWNAVSEFWNTLETDGILEPGTEQVSSYMYPVQSWVWFFVVLVLLGSEWFIRKTRSLP
ncbi:MAG: hypothetical protein AAFW89_14345 [Bacteroidota bacterium]